MAEPQPGSAPRLGRPPKITQRDIIEAVLAEGFAGLTVPAVAERLGVTSMTLYRHVPTRGHLLALAWDHVLGAHTWPSRDLPWRDLLRSHAIDLWQLLAAHPGSVTELAGAVLPARMMQLYDGLADAVAEQGFSSDAAVLAVDSVLDLAIDHRRGAENLEQPIEGENRRLREQIGSLWNADNDTTSEGSPVRASMRQAISADPRLWFERKLDLVLDGIAAQRKDPPA